MCTIDFAHAGDPQHSQGSSIYIATTTQWKVLFFGSDSQTSSLPQLNKVKLYQVKMKDSACVSIAVTATNTGRIFHLDPVQLDFVNLY